MNNLIREVFESTRPVAVGIGKGTFVTLEYSVDWCGPFWAMISSFHRNLE